MYLLPTFSGLSDTQVPIGASEKVAFIARVGSTQRVISRSCNLYLMFLLAFLTTSSVRTKCQRPLRKLGPFSPARTWDDSKGPVMIATTIRSVHQKMVLWRVARPHDVID